MLTTVEHPLLSITPRLGTTKSEIVRTDARFWAIQNAQRIQLGPRVLTCHNDL